MARVLTRKYNVSASDKLEFAPLRVDVSVFRPRLSGALRIEEIQPNDGDLNRRLEQLEADYNNYGFDLRFSRAAFELCREYALPCPRWVADSILDFLDCAMTPTASHKRAIVNERRWKERDAAMRESGITQHAAEQIVADREASQGLSSGTSEAIRKSCDEHEAANPSVADPDAPFVV